MGIMVSLHGRSGDTWLQLGQLCSHKPGQCSFSCNKQPEDSICMASLVSNLNVLARLYWFIDSLKEENTVLKVAGMDRSKFSSRNIRMFNFCGDRGDWVIGEDIVSFEREYVIVGKDVC